MRAIAVIALLGLLLGRGLTQAEPKPPADKEPAAPREATLSFSGEGERWWWAENAKGEPLSPPQKTRDASITIKLSPDADTLWVYDAKTGNLAQLKAADLKEKTELTSDRFSHVARVQVNLQAQGKPVASAVVQLTDADGKTHTRVLEPSAEGILIFERVPLGKVSITARYGDEGKAMQETTLKAERETRVPIIELALSGSVATLEVAPKGREGQGDAETPTTSRIGAIVMFVIALLLAVGVILFLVRLATQKPQQLGEAMSKLGVELPQPTPAGQGSATNRCCARRATTARPAAAGERGRRPDGCPHRRDGDRNRCGTRHAHRRHAGTLRRAGVRTHRRADDHRARGEPRNRAGERYGRQPHARANRPSGRPDAD
jgi:hypothetical protein